MSTARVLKRLLLALAGAIAMPFACAILLDTAQAAAGDDSAFAQQAGPAAAGSQASLGQLGRANAVAWVARGV